MNGAACLRTLRLHSLRERVSGTICTEHHSHPRSCPPQAYRSQMHYKREPKIVPGSTLFQVRVNYPKDWNNLAQWVTTYYNITRRTVLPLIQVPELHMQASFSASLECSGQLRTTLLRRLSEANSGAWILSLSCPTVSLQYTDISCLKLTQPGFESCPSLSWRPQPQPQQQGS